MKVQGLLAQNYRYVHQMNALSKVIGKSDTRLATGKKINTAADNPASMIRLSRFEAKVRGRHVAEKNIQDGLAFLEVRDNALSSLQNIAQSLRELAVRYENDSLSKDEKAVLEKQAGSLMKEMSDILKNTEFNGKKVFSDSDLKIQSGPNSKEQHTISGAKFGVIASIIEREEVNVYDTTYKIANIPNSTLTVKRKDGDNKQSFVIESNGKKLKGEFHFVNDRRATFTASWKGLSMRGTLELGVSGDMTNLEGRQSFFVHEIRVDEELFDLPEDNPFGFSFEFENKHGWRVDYVLQKTDETVAKEMGEVTKHIQFEDIAKLNPKDVLDTAFIDEKILDPLAKMRSDTGIEFNVLEERLSYNARIEAVEQEALSNLEDVDMAKELMQKVRNQLLLETNLAMFQQNLNSSRERVYQLLYS